MTEPFRPDLIDAVLASNRQRIILEMFNSGQLDAESAAAMYEATTRIDQVAADHEAIADGDFGPNTPSGILATLYFKLKGRE